jgi:hypothetical protein
LDLDPDASAPTLDEPADHIISEAFADNYLASVWQERGCPLESRRRSRFRTLPVLASDQIDSFLKAHEIWIDYAMKDLEREREGLRRLGL